MVQVSNSVFISNSVTSCGNGGSNVYMVRNADLNGGNGGSAVGGGAIFTTSGSLNAVTYGITLTGCDFKDNSVANVGNGGDMAQSLQGQSPQGSSGVGLGGAGNGGGALLCIGAQVNSCSFRGNRFPEASFYSRSKICLLTFCCRAFVVNRIMNSVRDASNGGNSGSSTVNMQVSIAGYYGGGL